MNTSEIQSKALKITAVLLLLSAVSLLVVIPAILLDKSSSALPVQAAIGALLGMALHLYGAYWLGIRQRRRRAKIRNEAFILLATALFFLGIMMLDGAHAFRNDVMFVSIGLYICASFDFAASLVSVIALILLRANKKK